MSLKWTSYLSQKGVSRKITEHFLDVLIDKLEPQFMGKKCGLSVGFCGIFIIENANQLLQSAMTSDDDLLVFIAF